MHLCDLQKFFTLKLFPQSNIYFSGQIIFRDLVIVVNVETRRAASIGSLTESSRKIM